MLRPGANSHGVRRSPIATALWSAMCCAVIATSSKVSIKSNPMRKCASRSMPTASCSCSFPEFAASSFREGHGFIPADQSRKNRGFSPCGSNWRTLRRTDVHTPHSGYCTVYDDHELHLLGLLGQPLQGRQELSLRIVLLGLRRRHFPGVADSRV